MLKLNIEEDKMKKNLIIIFNGVIYDLKDKQIQRELDRAKKNIKHLLEKLEESTEETYKNIQKHIDSEKEKIQLLLNHANKQIDDLTKEFENNMDTLRIQKNKREIQACI